MNPPNKKLPGTTGVPPGFRQQSTRVQMKSVVPSPKTAASAKSVKAPVSPPVYRPQPLPRVLQTKSWLAQNSPARQTQLPGAPAVASHSHTAQAVQAKAISQRRTPAAPPIFRPEHRGIAQLKLAAVRTVRNTPRDNAVRITPPRKATGLVSRTIQRTPQESENLMNLGLRWNKIAEKAPESPEKLEFFGYVKELQEKLGFKVYTVWHKHDPYVGGGKNKNYVKIIKALRGDDEGKTAADTYIAWATGGTTIDQVPHELQELIIIVHVAEVGRMYLDATARLLSFMLEVANAGSKEARAELWKEFKTKLPFALTAKEDTDYDPNEEV